MTDSSLPDNAEQRGGMNVYHPVPITPERVRELLRDVTPGPMKVLSPILDEEGEGDYSHCLMAEGYGIVGYWRGGKERHENTNWVLGRADAELLAASEPISQAYLTAMDKLEALSALTDKWMKEADEAQDMADRIQGKQRYSTSHRIHSQAITARAAVIQVRAILFPGLEED